MTVDKSDGLHCQHAALDGETIKYGTAFDRSVVMFSLLSTCTSIVLLLGQVFYINSIAANENRELREEMHRDTLSLHESRAYNVEVLFILALIPGIIAPVLITILVPCS